MVLADVGTVVPLDAKQMRRIRNFFPPLILLEAINECCKQNVARKASDSPPNPNQTPEEKFRTFVNKMAHICDHQPHGDTVTALTVLQDNGRVLYAFASNRRTRQNLLKTKTGILSVLNILKENLQAETSQSDEVLHDKLIREILSLNTVRVQCYLSALSKELKACIKACNTGNISKESKSATDALNDLLNGIPELGKQAGYKSDAFIGSTIRCIHTINRYRQLPLQNFIMKMAATDEKLRKESSCWAKLHHVAGRLLSYQYAAETLISAHHIWADEDLFREFDVDFLDPCGSYPAAALKVEPEPVEAIINRIPGGGSYAAALLQHATELEAYGLGEKLKEQWARELKPVVHAEILLHNWLSRTPGGIQPSRFFNNWQYIGTSKPVCRLCQYYFDVVATPVRFRDGHPNTYLHWRLPDVYAQSESDVDVEEARTGWRMVIDQVKARVHADLRRILVEKATDKKQNDSNTYTDRISLTSQFLNFGLD